MSSRSMSEASWRRKRAFPPSLLMLRKTLNDAVHLVQPATFWVRDKPSSIKGLLEILPFEVFERFLHGQTKAIRIPMCQK